MTAPTTDRMYFQSMLEKEKLMSNQMAKTKLMSNQIAKAIVDKPIGVIMITDSFWPSFKPVHLSITSFFFPIVAKKMTQTKVKANINEARTSFSVSTQAYRPAKKKKAPKRLITNLFT